MKTNSKNVAIMLITLFVITLAGEKANAQFAVNYTAKNSQGKITVTSVVKNLPVASKGTIEVRISNNASMSPIIQDTTDVVDSNKLSFSHLLPVSVVNPKLFFVKVIVVSKDTTGKIDTAKAVSFIPVLVTPKFKKPTMVLQKLVLSQTKGILNGTFSSGYDTAFIKILISYEDTLFSNPVYKYPLMDTIYAKVGGNQEFNLSFNLVMNVPDYYFSYKVYIYNSIGDIVSPKLWGKTLSTVGPAMVSSPSNIEPWSDSLSFNDITVSTGLETKHTSYIATSSTGLPIDSVLTVIPAGNGDEKIITKFYDLNLKLIIGFGHQ